MKFHSASSIVFSGTLLVLLSADLMKAADVSLSKQREIVVTAAVEALAARSSPVSLPDPAPNPFNWPQEAENTTESPVQVTEARPSAASQSELLGRIAAQIPVTGTVNLGGSPLLLLGQKRLKVGDNVTINYEGQSYDLIISAIAPTSFTVKRGELTHTRPTRISSSRQ